MQPSAILLTLASLRDQRKAGKTPGHILQADPAGLPPVAPAGPAMLTTGDAYGKFPVGTHVREIWSGRTGVVCQPEQGKEFGPVVFVTDDDTKKTSPVDADRLELAEPAAAPMVAPAPVASPAAEVIPPPAEGAPSPSPEELSQAASLWRANMKAKREVRIAAAGINDASVLSDKGDDRNLTYAALKAALKAGMAYGVPYDDGFIEYVKSKGHGWPLPKDESGSDDTPLLDYLMTEWEEEGKPGSKPETKVIPNPAAGQEPVKGSKGKGRSQKLVARRKVWKLRADSEKNNTTTPLDDPAAAAEQKAGNDELDELQALVNELKARKFMNAELEYPGFIQLFDVPGMPKDFYINATPWWDGEGLPVEVQSADGRGSGVLHDKAFPPRGTPVKELADAYMASINEILPKAIEVAEKEAKEPKTDESGDVKGSYEAVVKFFGYVPTKFDAIVAAFKREGITLQSLLDSKGSILLFSARPGMTADEILAGACAIGYPRATVLADLAAMGVTATAPYTEKHTPAKWMTVSPPEAEPNMDERKVAAGPKVQAAPPASPVTPPAAHSTDPVPNKVPPKAAGTPGTPGSEGSLPAAVAASQQVVAVPVGQLADQDQFHAHYVKTLNRLWDANKGKKSFDDIQKEALAEAHKSFGPVDDPAQAVAAAQVLADITPPMPANPPAGKKYQFDQTLKNGQGDWALVAAGLVAENTNPNGDGSKPAGSGTPVESVGGDIAQELPAETGASALAVAPIVPTPVVPAEPVGADPAVVAVAEDPAPVVVAPAIDPKPEAVPAADAPAVAAAKSLTKLPNIDSLEAAKKVLAEQGRQVDVSEEVPGPDGTHKFSLKGNPVGFWDPATKELSMTNAGPLPPNPVKTPGVKAAGLPGRRPKGEAGSGPAIVAAGMWDAGEELNGCHIRIYKSDDEKLADPYTIAVEHDADGEISWLGAGPDPFHPQGFGQHIGNVDENKDDDNEHLGTRVKLAEVPEPVKKFIEQETKGWDEAGVNAKLKASKVTLQARRIGDGLSEVIASDGTVVLCRYRDGRGGMIAAIVAGQPHVVANFRRIRFYTDQWFGPLLAAKAIESGIHFWEALNRRLGYTKDQKIMAAVGMKEAGDTFFWISMSRGGGYTGPTALQIPGLKDHQEFATREEAIDAVKKAAPAGFKMERDEPNLVEFRNGPETIVIHEGSHKMTMDRIKQDIEESGGVK